jgi:hypothetical protein
VDGKFTTLVENISTDKLDTLTEIATALQGDASFGINVYQRISSLDASIGTIRTDYATTASLSSYATTASLSDYASLIRDVSFAGNIQMGTSRAVSVGINKIPSSLYALDVSGPTFFSGNVSLDKRSTDISYAYFDMSAVTMNVYNMCEKFVTMPTLSGTSIVCNYALGSIFYFPSTGTSVITSVSITNVPVVYGRSLTVTVIIENSSNSVVSYLNPAGTPATISVNGVSIAYKTQDGTAFAAPSPPASGYWQVVHQFILLFTPTNPRVIGSMSTIK